MEDNGALEEKEGYWGNAKFWGNALFCETKEGNCWVGGIFWEGKLEDGTWLEKEAKEFIIRGSIIRGSITLYCKCVQNE